jgi:hypothetical protein
VRVNDLAPIFAVPLAQSSKAQIDNELKFLLAPPPIVRLRLKSTRVVFRAIKQHNRMPCLFLLLFRLPLLYQFMQTLGQAFRRIRIALIFIAKIPIKTQPF